MADKFPSAFTSGTVTHEKRVAVPDGVVDMVNSPLHYHQENPMYEPAKVIRAWELPWALGDAVKYIARAGRKGDKAEDLRKAIWYITDEIDAIDPKPQASPKVVSDTWPRSAMSSRGVAPQHDHVDMISAVRTALSGIDDVVRTDKTARDLLEHLGRQGWVLIRASDV